MHSLRAWILSCMMLVMVASAHAQLGRQFWFASPELALHSADMQMRLCLFADSLDADVTISMPAAIRLPIHDIHLKAGGYEQVVLATNYDEYMRYVAAYHNQVLPRAYYIQSSSPISCYVQISGVNGEIYTLKGEDALGTSFCLAMQNHFRNSNSTNSRGTYSNAYASAQIVATEDSTIVVIEPTQVLYGDTAILPRQIRLNRGEVYSFRAASKSAQAHPTATRIYANHPIVMHTMDDSMSPYQKYYGEDAVAEQQVPVSLLGNEYIALGHGLKWEGLVVTDLETDSTEFISMNGKRSLYLHREHPIQVFQVTGCANEAGGSQLPPLTNTGSRCVHYVRPQDSRWTRIYILTPTSNTDAIYVNDRKIEPAQYEPVQGAPDWSFTMVDMSRYTKQAPMTVRSRGDIFHMSVIDGSSASKNAQGQPVATSSSFGYFSSYAKTTVYAPAVDTVSLMSDTLVAISPIASEEGKDKDSVESKPNRHHLNLYMQGAYSHIPFGNRDYLWGLGYGAGLGLLYEYQYRHFLLDIGAGFLWQDVEHRSQQDMTLPFVDTQGDMSTIQMRIKRSDRLRMAYVEMPLLLGGIWQWFYMLGGVKVGTVVYGNARSEVRVTDYAEYNQYFVPFSGMANHGLQTDVPKEHSESRPQWMLDTRLSLELGWHWQRYRLALYADYGALFPTLDNGDTPCLKVDDWANLSTWEIHHPLNSSLINAHYAHNFFTGIKFTIQLWAMGRNGERGESQTTSSK